jgi:hypothetical protein
MPTLRLAVICMAYLGTAAGAELLAHYFAAGEVDIWLHVDAAADQAEYRALAKRTANLRLAAARRRCWWGGFNGALAVLATAEAAQRAKAYDRFLYVTEDSVPLRPLRRLLACLAQDVEYIEMTCVEPLEAYAGMPQLRDHAAHLRSRYERFYCWDCDAMNPERSFDDRSPIVTPELEQQLARLAQLRARGKTPLPRLWHGPPYWALSARAIEELLTRHRYDTRLRESFEFSAIPEEQYYHTILGESAWPIKTAPFMLMDFSRDPQPFVFRSEDELVALQPQPHLFARKIDFHSESVIRFVEGLTRQDG